MNINKQHNYNYVVYLYSEVDTIGISLYGRNRVTHGADVTIQYPDSSRQYIFMKFCCRIGKEWS